ncbi:hypothetical protein DFH28DRAFT_1106231 [Melampsora americana]|nr:hypothetical protein DFH28DRAFT_1106231 [Melampsora americana]
MKTFVFYWLLAVLINQSVGHAFITSRSYENLSKKLESLPTFEPMNSKNQFNSKGISSLNLMSPSEWNKQRVTKLDRWGEISWRIDDISEPFGFVRSSLEAIIFGSPSLGNSENKFIYHAIDLFEKEDLNIIQRIWMLGVLRILQDHSPTIKHPLLSNCIQEGPLCRAGLELSLTQSFDLFSQLEKALQNSKINEAFDPCLQRVELLGRINKWKQEDSKVEKSEGFQMIYDTLLQADCPIKLTESVSLVNNCITHMMRNTGSKEEVKWTYGVLYHLYSSCKEVRDVWKFNLGKPKLQAIQQSLSKQMKYQEVVKDAIESYLSTENSDPFISNLLLPFKEILPVTLKHYMYIIDCFEAQGKRTHPSQLKGYWLDSSDYSRYTYSKAFVIDMLRKASPYIQDTQPYLKSRLKIEDGKYKFIPLENSNIENHNKEGLECSISLNVFILGEHCIKPNCNPKHIFHYKCLKTWTNGFAKRLATTDHSNSHPNCPVCRTSIGPEFNTNQHIFWWEDQNIHQNIPAVQPVIEDHIIKEGSGLEGEPSSSKSGSLRLLAKSKRPAIDDGTGELNTMTESKKSKLS